MIWLAIVVAGASLGVSLLVAEVLRRVGSIGLQLAGLAFLSAIVPLSAVLLSGWVMFHMGADAKILTVTAAAAAAAVVAGLVLARGIARPLEGLRAAAGAVAAGELDARAPRPPHGELAQVADAFNAMAASVEQLFEARRDLVAWASHDLRTPLASLRAVIEAAEDDVLHEDEALPLLREQAEKLTGLVDDLFELVQLDAGTLSLRFEQMRLADIVSSTLRTVGPEAAARNVRLEAAVDPATTALVAPDKLERALTNVVANAIRHASNDVAVTVGELEGAVLVRVEDDGEGIGDDSLERMFERFWRGDPARSTTGAGLGLAIARGVVEAHGGRIWAENRSGGGARVSFSLPRGSATGGRASPAHPGAARGFAPPRR